MKVLLALIAGMTVVGCGGDGPSQPREPIDFYVANHILTRVELSADGKNLGSLPAGAGMVVVTTSRSVQWARANVTMPDGRTIADDMMSGSVQAPDAIMGLVPIENIAGGEVFFAPRVINSSGTPVTVGIFGSGSLRCIATAPTSASSFLGYYRLTTSTELRFYWGSACTGTFSTMPNSDLQTYEHGTGALLIEVSVP